MDSPEIDDNKENNQNQIIDPHINAACIKLRVCRIHEFLCDYDEFLHPENCEYVEFLIPQPSQNTASDKTISKNKKNTKKLCHPLTERNHKDPSPPPSPGHSSHVVSQDTLTLASKK